jgi:hypothetical protein
MPCKSLITDWAKSISDTLVSCRRISNLSPDLQPKRPKTSGFFRILQNKAVNHSLLRYANAGPSKLGRKTFPRKSIHAEISPLRSPGFPVEVRGVDHLHAVSFEGKPHPWSWRVQRSRKSGYAPVEMTKGRAALPGRVVAEQEPFFITLGGPKAHDNSVEKTFPRRIRRPQVPALPPDSLSRPVAPITRVER